MAKRCPHPLPHNLVRRRPPLAEQGDEDGIRFTLDRIMEGPSPISEPVDVAALRIGGGGGGTLLNQFGELFLHSSIDVINATHQTSNNESTSSLGPESHSLLHSPPSRPTDCVSKTDGWVVSSSQAQRHSAPLCQLKSEEFDTKEIRFLNVWSEIPHQTSEYGLKEEARGGTSINLQQNAMMPRREKALSLNARAYNWPPQGNHNGFREYSVKRLPTYRDKPWRADNRSVQILRDRSMMLHERGEPPCFNNLVRPGWDNLTRDQIHVEGQQALAPNQRTADDDFPNADECRGTY
ncbi:hypothetical protein MBM_00905 [Drepanopeziza brunnea f. sp. 'multigermtubi' MB_m1]|uniref:Uncharacterized protein n=1 Tax=Marssonina brunnea f. sp. multigermtubi (strain MB_m1) TaxID=1072389 RepID=K1X9U8_MARBU|nr:uncharacterized protein MBM_00905 [Drepanopeziza brunnea f. sp. 'multigermtubi' MB_m1]EKD21792.1 hypothetical protein MBM_00905 [Drepanopeziza brunnea f. sp. 'multigermtubi' MB_m1]